MYNRSTSEKCGGEFERITRWCNVEGTKGVGLSCHFETRLVGGDRGGRNYSISIRKTESTSVAAAVGKAFVEADGEGKEIG